MRQLGQKDITVESDGREDNSFSHNENIPVSWLSLNTRALKGYITMKYNKYILTNDKS
jgi:hypothetical protein